MAPFTEDDIRELAAFRGEGAPVTSCYLDVDGRRFIRQQDVEHELEAVLRDVRGRADGQPSVADDLTRFEEHVRAGIDRSTTRGLAMFSCSAHGLWRTIALSVPVRSRVVVNSAPAVSQLEMILSDYRSFGVLLVDKQRARMFVFELGELTDRSEVFDEVPRAVDSRGHSDLGYDREQHHVEEHTHQHLKHAAEVAFRVWQDHGFDHLTIGAADPIHHELEQCLHPYLRERLCGRVAVAPTASLEEIRDAALALEVDVEREAEAALVTRLRDAVGAGQRAAAGLEAVLPPLNEHRVEHLLVSDGFHDSGWRCGACKALAKVGPSCPACGAEMARVEDVVEDAVEDALAQGVRVSICVNADLDVLGRIGAFLRY